MSNLFIHSFVFHSWRPYHSRGQPVQIILTDFSVTAPLVSAPFWGRIPDFQKPLSVPEGLCRQSYEAAILLVPEFQNVYNNVRASRSSCLPPDRNERQMFEGDTFFYLRLTFLTFCTAFLMARKSTSSRIPISAPGPNQTVLTYCRMYCISQRSRSPIQRSSRQHVRRG